MENMITVSNKIQPLSGKNTIRKGRRDLMIGDIVRMEYTTDPNDNKAIFAVEYLQVSSIVIGKFKDICDSCFASNHADPESSYEISNILSGCYGEVGDDDLFTAIYFL